MILEREAFVSGPYRYRLSRRWRTDRGRAVFVLLNPSVADSERDDPTIRVCTGFAERWGCGQLVVLNLFALVSTDPAALALHPDPIGPANDGFLFEARGGAEVVVAAWGDGGRLHSRDRAVMALLRGTPIRCLGVTRSGSPRHPLRISYSTPLSPFVVQS